MKSSFKSVWRRGSGQTFYPFPAGALSDPAGVLEELDLSGFSMDRNLKESAEKGGRSYGVPLYFGGAVLVTNDDLIYSKDLMPPSGHAGR